MAEKEIVELLSSDEELEEDRCSVKTPAKGIEMIDLVSTTPAAKKGKEKVGQSSPVKFDSERVEMASNDQESKCRSRRNWDGESGESSNSETERYYDAKSGNQEEDTLSVRSEFDEGQANERIGEGVDNCESTQVVEDHEDVMSCEPAEEIRLEDESTEKENLGVGAQMQRKQKLTSKFLTYESSSDEDLELFPLETRKRTSFSSENNLAESFVISGDPQLRRSQSFESPSPEKLSLSERLLKRSKTIAECSDLRTSIFLSNPSEFQSLQTKRTATKRTVLTAEERERRKQEKEQAKEQAKIRRETAKKQKEEIKLREKALKNDAKIRDKVDRGDFSRKEMRVVMEKGFACSEKGKLLAQYLGEKEVSTEEEDLNTFGLVLFKRMKFRTIKNTGLDVDPVEVVDGEPILDTSDPGKFLPNALLLICPEDVFIQILLSERARDDLQKYVSKAVDEWKRLAPPCGPTSSKKRRKSFSFKVESPKPVLILSGVKDAINRKLKQLKKEALRDIQVNEILKRCTIENLMSLLDYALLTFSCESWVLGSDQGDLFKTILNLVSATESSFYAKKSCFLDNYSAKGSGMALETDSSTPAATQTWISQLQWLTSENKAIKIGARFPTFTSLMQAYQSSSYTSEEKEMLLANLFEDRQHAAVSRRIFRHMTASDPNLLLR